MTAIISTTFDDNYLFLLPITAWSWNKLGVDVICFMPRLEKSNDPRFGLIVDLKWWNLGLNLQFMSFKAPDNKKATYAQCARLYGAASGFLLEDDEVLITGDVDMAVFNKEFFQQFNDGQIHVAGADLVPDFQYPICYVAMSATAWRAVMWIKGDETYQEKLDQLLGNLECEHFRGNYWAKDQESIYNYLFASNLPINKHFRAKPGTQFATRRADRDGWPEVIPPDIIDAHLPRPGYTPENFAKILNLFQTMYPEDDFQWMIDYRNEYVKYLNQ